MYVTVHCSTSLFQELIGLLVSHSRFSTKKKLSFMCIFLLFLGVGKTHYIRKELRKLTEFVVISLNETFTVANAITKLNELNRENHQCGIFFNYTMSPPGVR